MHLQIVKMKRGIGFGKIGLNLGQMKLAEKEPDKDKEDEHEDVGGGFGSFGKKDDSNKITNLMVTENEATDPSDDYVEEVNPDLAKLMGFSGFGSTHKSNRDLLKDGNTEKKAQQFDVDAMFASVAKTAQERNLMNNQKLEEAGKADLEGVFVVPGEKKGESSKVMSGAVKTSDDEGDSDSDEDVVGPLPPPGTVKKSNDEDDDDSGEDHEVTPVDKIPRSHEIKLEHGSRAITSLALDPSGARVISGAVDYELKFWDFAGNKTQGGNEKHAER